MASEWSSLGVSSPDRSTSPGLSASHRGEGMAFAERLILLGVEGLPLQLELHIRVAGPWRKNKQHIISIVA